MKILFLHEVNYLTKPIFEMHEFPEHLAAKGHEVGFIQFPEGQSITEVRALGWKRLIPGRVLPESRIILYTPQNASGSLLGRFKTAATFFSTFRKVLNEFQPDIVVNFSVPTSGWQASLASKRAGIPFIYRALDVSHKIRRSLFSPLVFIAEKAVNQQSSWVSANNYAMLRYCRSIGANRLSSSVEFPPIDLTHFDNKVSSGLRTRLGIPGDSKVIIYLGTFFHFSGLVEALDYFIRFSRSDEYFVLLGGGVLERSLRKLASRSDCTDRIIFTGFVPFDNLPEYLHIASVGVNPMVKSLVSNAAFPNKVIQYLASGLAVASSALDGLLQTFEASEGIRYGNTPGQVMIAALDLARRNDVIQLGARNRSSLNRHFELNSAVSKMETRILEVVEVE